VLVTLEGRLGDLGELELQQLELALARCRELVQTVELSLQAHGLVVCLGAGAQSRGLPRAAGLVQELQLGSGDRELAVLVLPVERKEARTEIAQIADGGRAPVQVCACAPVAGHTPSENDLAGVGGQALAALPQE
jgi:hypothetical protein